jgi:hypothetical protein
MFVRMGYPVWETQWECNQTYFRKGLMIMLRGLGLHDNPFRFEPALAPLKFTGPNWIGLPEAISLTYRQALSIVFAQEGINNDGSFVNPLTDLEVAVLYHVNDIVTRMQASDHWKAKLRPIS